MMLLQKLEVLEREEELREAAGVYEDDIVSLIRSYQYLLKN